MKGMSHHSQLASNFDPPNLCLPSNQDYKHGPPASIFILNASDKNFKAHIVRYMFYTDLLFIYLFIYFGGTGT
jgi:hypothetical protein